MSLRRSAQFSGRLRRREYWLFALSYVTAYILARSERGVLMLAAGHALV